MLPDEGYVMERAVLSDNLALAYARTGEPEKALSTSNEARKLHRSVDSRAELYSVVSLARAYSSVGQYDLAGDLFGDAIKMLEEVEDGRIHRAVMRELGDLHYRQGNYQEALEIHRQALARSSTAFDKATFLVRIGRVQLAAARQDDARESIDAALLEADDAEAPALLASTHEELGNAYLQSGELDRAEEEYLRALEIYKTLQLPDEQATVHHKLAEAYSKSGRIEESLAYGGEAIEIVDAVQASMSAAELRAHNKSAHRRIYEHQIATLVRAGEDEQALSLSERIRATMSLTLSQESEVDALDQEELLTRLQDLHAHMAEVRRRIDRDPISASQGNSELAALEVEIDDVRSQLRREKPVLRVRTRDAAQIQAALDSETQLLQFVLSDYGSVAWVVDRDSIRSVELPARDEIVTAVQSALGYLRNDGTPEALEELSELVIAPVEELLVKRRVLIAPDDALHYVPFDILSGSAATLLLDTHEIVVVPSVSLILDQRGRSRDPTDMQIAVFADPVFNEQDPRLREVQLSDTSRSAHSLADDMPRLSGTGREAETIATLVPQERLQIATGFDATRGALMDPGLSRFQYVHVATHGLVDARYPELSTLVMSSRDPNGRPIGGEVRLHDIFQLRLNADLVVLSACDTALGRAIRSEGLVGFATGFLDAGARTVLVSLWQVPDRATDRLMQSFYQHLLVDQVSAAEALRRAKKDVARRWRHPHYWGAFVLIGDWDTSPVSTGEIET
jgi:CHAT domain-containing protein/predicted negative regulator of RcsB-dependent stress response